MTKRQYEIRLAELNFKHDMLLTEWQAGSERIDRFMEEEAEERENALKLGEWCNQLDSAAWETEQEIRALDFEWDTRDWTSSDWYQWELVNNNCD